jgi:gluconolactonase
MRLLPFLLLGAIWCTQGLFAQNTMNFPVLGRIVREDPRLDQILGPDAKIEVLAGGFEWAEGPVWHPGEKAVLFSDIPNNAVMIWRPGVGASVYLKPAGFTGILPYGLEPGSNGLTFDPQGRLVSAEHGDRRISVLTKDGGKRTIVDNYMGKRLNSPNDAVYDSQGNLYFTDPPYGLPKNWDDPRRELDFCGVYRYSKDGKLTLLTRDMTRPNGIALSPDEKTLYVAQSDPKAAIWMAYPLAADGAIGKGRVFANVTSMVGKFPGLPDGMKVDEKGNLWATGPGGVHIYAPDGKLLGRLDTGEATANVAWGDDGSTLYITADMYLCRVKTKTRGAGLRTVSAAVK